MPFSRCLLSPSSPPPNGFVSRWIFRELNLE
jgi:hypothetical protein